MTLRAGAAVFLFISVLAVELAVHRRRVSLAIPLAGIPAEQYPDTRNLQHGCGTVADSHRLSHLFPAASSPPPGESLHFSVQYAGYLNILPLSKQALFLAGCLV